jgi:hypothetical protein
MKFEIKKFYFSHKCIIDSLIYKQFFKTKFDLIDQVSDEL